MKAFALTDFDSAPTITDIPLPDPGPGQVRVRVRAAALNGIVEAVGDGVTGISIGDELLGHYALGSELHHGTLAEQALLTADATVVKPASLAFREAAALPLAGSAALRAV